MQDSVPVLHRVYLIRVRGFNSQVCDSLKRVSCGTATRTFTFLAPLGISFTVAVYSNSNHRSRRVVTLKTECDVKATEIARTRETTLCKSVRQAFLMGSPLPETTIIKLASAKITNVDISEAHIS
jgi:hypothetical protein